MLPILAALILTFQPVFGGEKLSLQKKTESLKKADEISNLYKSTADLARNPKADLKPLLAPNRKALDELEKDFQGSASFVRGEIEDEKTLSRVLSYLQLAMLRARVHSFESNWSEVQKDFSAWFLFAADFPYDESSLVGLRTTGVLRSLLLDDLEKIQKKFSKEIAQTPALRVWLLQIRAPWPVDRVFVTEAKRLLKPPMMSVANAAAQAFQKNPYQTSQKALEKVKGGQSQEAQLLKEIWRESDIDLMKTEINRIGYLQLRMAQAEFELQNKKAASSYQELLNAHLLERVPIDYFSGKPLDLTSL